VRICVAQHRPIAGDIAANARRHGLFVDLAIARDANLICFPELSLTGYEPKLASNLATHQDDPRFDAFQEAADAHCLYIAVGAPTAARSGTRISMIVFRPGISRAIYSKQQLHADELAYFIPGEEQLVLDLAGHSVAPAICYESLQDSHAEMAANLGADVYLASVAKSARGVEKAYSHYPAVARRHSVTVLMANCVGSCDDFVAVGRSAVWSSRGEVLISLDDEHEGIALIDTETGEPRAYYL
jgi:predicted amidohydrolase